MQEPRESGNVRGEITKAEREALREWGRKPRPIVKKCRTCRRYPELVPLIRAYLEEMAAGEIDVDLITFRREQLVPRGYQQPDNTLRNHARNCEEELYAKIAWR